MLEFLTIDDVLQFAIGEEEAAATFYTEMAARMTRSWMREVFEGFAQEEKGHKAKLEKIRAGGSLRPAEGKVLDLKLADYLVVEEANAQMDYQAALILAMKKEKSAFRLYSDLARTFEHEERLEQAFLALAQEEAKHKLRFEVEYDNEVLRDN